MSAHFTAEQIAGLAAPLSRANVATRKGAGSMQLSYIESHHAIREANRIFGFDGWSSETIDLRCIVEKADSVSYLARVRITVYAGERSIVREGVGYGHGKSQSNIGDAHEKAGKEAESDAQKRALRHFGDQFGLALYDKAQEHVTSAAHDAPRQDRAASQSAPAPAPRAVAPSTPAQAPPAPKPQSGKVSASLITACDKRRAAIMKGTANLQAMQSDHLGWVDAARADWPNLVDVDRRLVMQAKERLEAALAEAIAGEARIAARRATAAQHDPDTGEIAETAAA